MQFLTALLVACAGFVQIASATPAQPDAAHGKGCRKPSVRREWRTLSSDDKKSYIDAVKCLATLPHNPNIAPDGSEPDIPPVNASASLYDDFVYVHMDGVIRNHFTGVFLSWHRWFLHTFESTLRTECNFNGSIPYWDWSQDVANITAAPVFTSDPSTGFGTFNPSAAENFSVTDGAFGQTVRTYPTPHLVGRNFRPQPFLEQIFPFEFNEPQKFAVEAFTPSEVQYITTHFEGNYTDFQAYMDGTRAEGMHNAAHLMLEGDMSDISHSPNDPIFFLHHANLDRIWARWQAHSPKNALATGGGRTQDLADYDDWPAGAPPFIAGAREMIFGSGLIPNGTTIRIGDVLRTDGGYLCYHYE